MKLPIIKDRPRNYKKSTFYWRKIRRIMNNIIRTIGVDGIDNKGLPDVKSLVNDYNYSDYTIINNEDKKFTRK